MLERILFKGMDIWELVNNEIHRLNVIRKSLENVIDKLYEETTEYKIDNEI